MSKTTHCLKCGVSHKNFRMYTDYYQNYVTCAKCMFNVPVPSRNLDNHYPAFYFAGEDELINPRHHKSDDIRYFIRNWVEMPDVELTEHEKIMLIRFIRFHPENPDSIYNLKLGD